MLGLGVWWCLNTRVVRLAARLMRNSLTGTVGRSAPHCPGLDGYPVDYLANFDIRLMELVSGIE
jgi:hypothetical protein